MARRIVLTSGKGGVGKSTLCLTLGRSLAQLGAKVVMLDVDVGLHNLDIIAGIETEIIFDIVDVIEGKVRLTQALVADKLFKNLYFLPSCHMSNVGKVSPQSLKDILKELEDFDYILIDCPAGIDFGFHSAVFCACEAIIVTTPALSSVNAADKVASLLCNYNLNAVGIVVNRVNKKLKSQKNFVKDISFALKLPLLSIFYECRTITNNLGILSDEVCDKVFQKSAKQFALNIFYGNYNNQKEYY